MSGFLERLRVRPDRRKVYDLDDSDDDVFVSKKIQTAEQVKEVNPLAELERILDFEMRCTLANQTDSDNVAPEQVFVKQYLVKWKGLSYLHCSWVPEQEFEKAYKFNPRLRTSMNKFHSRMDGIRNNGDDFVAIRPEWTTVDRIIASRGEEDGKKYLVKFKELSYDECCWESESDISTFQNEIQRFKDINSGSRRDKYVENEINRKEFKQLDHTPDFLKGSLHPYQLEGLNFLRFSWSKRTHVILADEMGLGKTIQSIAFLASLFEENLAPHLVVVPLSTLRNWEKEFGTWAPHMNVVVYGGNSKARTVIREHEFYFKKMKSGQISGEKKQDRIKFDVLLTSYEMINIDIAVLKSIKWKCLIVDEGHRLKNKDSRLFSSLKQYKSKHRVLLTGTPLQNNLDELFVLMHFLDVGKFGSLEEFQEEFKDINQEEQISRLHKMLSPHMLRRINTDVLKDTPPKKELILRVDLSSQQKQMYKAIITGNYQILAEKRGVRISSVLMELRKVCLHPYMVEGITPYIQDADAAHRKLLESSGKLQLLDKLMVKLKEQGHRVLVYTHFKHMLDLLEDYCTYKNWFYERLDGKVGGAERQIRIDRFNAKSSNRFCFLLSTRAGGLGINLATADTVIIYDSDWNPHADLQAMARAYRLGQTNKVMIYRLINRGTIEEKMMEMAKKKMLLEHLVVGKLKEQNLSQDELDDIIRYGSKELFCEETKEAGKIHYDDAAIEHLLDRNLVDSEEVSVDGKDENGFLKAFKVANFEYIDENDAAASVKAQAIENKSSASNSDRAKFWEELLKDKYEVHQSEKLNTLGKRKRKRNRKQMFEEYDLAGLEVSSDDETEPTNEQEPGQGNQTGKRPYRRKNRERSLSVLGFEKNERKVFLQTIMRYGVGNYDWKDFIKPLEQKTYEEIKDYGVLFLKHLIEDTEDSAPDYSDGVPKEGLKRDEVLARISLLMLVKEKSKFVEDHPTKPIFPNRILQRFPGLQSGNPWKEEHDKILLHGVSKHGFGKWVTILEDKQLGIKKLICEELNFPYTVLSAAEEASLPESSLNQKSDTPGNNNASANAGKKKTMIPYRDIMRKLGDFVRRRFSVLELALKYECAEEYYRQNSSSLTLTEQPETETLVTDTVGTVAIETGQEMLDELPQAKLITQGEISASVVDNKQERLEMAQLCNQTCGNLEENSRESVETYLNGQPLSRKLGENLSPMESISENISRSLSVVGTEHDDVEMKDSEEKAEEDVDVKLKAAETDHVIVLD